MPPIFRLSRFLRIFCVFLSLLCTQCKGDALLDLPPSLNLNIVEIDFGSIYIEQIARQEIVLSNPGGGQLEIELILDAGTRAKGFAVENSLTHAKIAGQNELKIGLLFTPTAIGLHSGVLRIKTNDAERSDIAINLHGNGLGPALCTWPYSVLDFGDVQQDIEVVQQIALDNCGTSTLCIEGFNWTSESNNAFTVVDAPQTPHCLESGEMLTLDVRFSAQSLGHHQATLEILSDAPGEMVEVLIKGNALPPPACLNTSPSALNFNETAPPILVGETRTQSLHIENCSTWDIALSHVEITGPGAEAFSVELIEETFPLDMVAEGGAADFSLTFNPIEASAYHASLMLYHCLNCDEEDETYVAIGSVTLQGAAEIPCVPTSTCCGESCETQWELVRNGHFSQYNLIETTWDQNSDAQIKDPLHWHFELDANTPTGGSYLGDGIWPDFETSPQHWMESFYDNVWYGDGMIFHKKLGSTNDTWDFVSQEINLDVSLCTSLRLSMDGRINNQSKSGIGNDEGTWPLMVRITYIDQDGVVRDNFSSAESSGWQHGFYALGTPGYLNGPEVNGADHSTKLEMGQWHHTDEANGHAPDKFVSDNLMATLDPAPAKILAIKIGAAGWDYTSVADVVSLVGAEPACVE
ncbi:MAG: choice-of-anchor D domain-containing protein [Myxococcota bacterium]|nr:choice-of-anchor D domain-containing protein [Myxococcota bacterium]